MRYYHLSIYFILIGGGFDFFDGLFAYKNHAVTQMGKQLDSMADLVTFGIAPAFLYFQFLDFTFLSSGLFVIIIYVSSAVCRLAKFNLLTHVKTKNYFIGLPVTVAGCGFVSYLLFLRRLDMHIAGWPTSLIVICLSLLMISNFHYKSLSVIRKIKFSIVFTFFIIFLVLIIILHFVDMLFFAFLVYIMYGLISGVLKKWLLQNKVNKREDYFGHSCDTQV